MKHTLSLSLALVSVCLLTACGSKTPVAPQINFIGIGTGSLTTDVNKINFRQMFSPTERQLIAVVSFAQIENGSTVQATWFSPDERSIPLGRTPITTQSGARIARFSFASQVDWQSAPYELRIDVQTKNGTPTPMTTSGALHFFIGMKEKDIQTYATDFQAWMKEEDRLRNLGNKQVAAEDALKVKAKAVLGSEQELSILLRKDMTADGKMDYLFTPGNAEDFPSSQTPGVVFSAPLKQFVILNESGSLMLLMKKTGTTTALIDGSKKELATMQNAESVNVVILPSQTFSLSWQDKKKNCTQEIHYSAGNFTASPQMCQ